MKIDATKLFNLNSFEDAKAQTANFKDEGGVLLNRQLTHLSPEIFLQQYAGLTFLQQGITINNEGGFAAAIEKIKLNIQGGFADVGDSTSGMGKITMGAESDLIKVLSREAESAWSEIELKRAELGNINLPNRFISGHNEVYNRDLDQIGYLGHGSNKGLLNTNWGSASASGNATTLTGAELFEEFAALITDQWNGVFNTPDYMANQVVMSHDVYNLISAKKVGDSATAVDTDASTDDQEDIVASATAEASASAVFDNRTVLQALRETFPTVTFGSTNKAYSVDLSGATKVAVAFSNNRNAMQFRIPVPLMISSVYQKGFKYFMESLYGVGGLDVIESTAGRTLKGL